MEPLTEYRSGSLEGYWVDRSVSVAGIRACAGAGLCRDHSSGTRISGVYPQAAVQTYGLGHNCDGRLPFHSDFGKPAPIPIPGARLGRNGRNYDIIPDGKHFIRDRAGIHGKCRGPAVPRNKSTLF